MKIGNYEIFTLETGYIGLDGGAMFGVVPKALWSKTNPADEQNRIQLAMRTMVIRNDKRTILVDAGVGQKMNDKLQKIYKVDHEQYDLVGSLRKAGIEPQDVTDVIVTHLHFDHVGGATYYDATDNLQLTFPRAQFHVQGEQWHWAHNPSEKDKASYMPENFQPIQDQGKLNQLPGPQELFPGIDVLVVYGHTHGMQLPRISADDKTVLYCADLIPTASHIPLPYIMAYDNNPMITLQEKKRILPQALEQNWLLVFEHDPYHAAGYVEKDDKGYRLGREEQLHA
ncbi:MAG: MBL fold metallo-hydrolase [Caldithrix sp.]|nr:MBL fold metallo-hydrolase [Caldithrix sp.]